MVKALFAGQSFPVIFLHERIELIFDKMTRKKEYKQIAKVGGT